MRHERRPRFLIIVAAMLAALASAVSCSSGPEPAAAVPSVSCDLLSSREISFLSATRDTNPFFPIAGLLRGSPDEFVVLRIRLSLPGTTAVALEGSTRDGTGTDVAPLQTLSQMKKYWDTPEDLANRDKVAKANTLIRWYPPEPQFTAPRDRSEYLVVFKGKNPIPRPATISLSVTLGDAEPQEFTFPLPPKT